MAKMDWHEHERSTGLFSSETYWTYTVQRDDGSGYRTFTDRDEAQLYYNQLQALDNQEESLRLQRQEAVDRAEQIRIQKQNQQPDWMRRMPPRPQPIPQQPAIRKCAKCGAALLDDSLFCHNCSARREKCSCGGFLDAGMRFCPKCGKPTLEEFKRLAEEKCRRAAEQKRKAEEKRRLAEERRQEEERRREEEFKRLAEEKWRKEAEIAEQKRQQKIENFKFWWCVFCVLLGVIMFIVVAILTDGFNHPL